MGAEGRERIGILRGYGTGGEQLGLGARSGLGILVSSTSLLHLSGKKKFLKRKSFQSESNLEAYLLGRWVCASMVTNNWRGDSKKLYVNVSCFL